MKTYLLFLITLVSTKSFAQPKIYRNECLKTVIKEEVDEPRGRTLGPMSFDDKETLSPKYTWDEKKQKVIKMKDRETAWDPQVFLNDDDGRVPLRSLKNEKISSDDLNKIQEWYLTQYSVAISHLAKPVHETQKNQAIYFDRMYAACENVEDIKLKNGLTLGKSATRRRSELRLKYRDFFKERNSKDSSFHGSK
ncbi:MAG: hypothetical protein ACXWRE_09845 [Pseudobdellovibrionaceae bacterium]